MSHKIGKYTYENEEVLKEFISKLLAKLAKGKGLRTLAKIRKDPEVDKYLKNVTQNLKKLDQKAKKDPELDRIFKKLGY